jgi:hypothetical protein
MEAGRLVVDLPVAEFLRSDDPLVRAYMEAFSALPDSVMVPSNHDPK